MGCSGRIPSRLFLAIAAAVSLEMSFSFQHCDTSGYPMARGSRWQSLGRLWVPHPARPLSAGAARGRCRTRRGEGCSTDGLQVSAWCFSAASRILERGRLRSAWQKFERYL